MTYSLPRYMIQAGVDDRIPQFKWDDWNPDADFQYDSEKVVERLAEVSLRAKIAVGIGMYEWILGRFRSVCDDPAPFHVAEAAWCTNVRRDYMYYFEWRRRDWLGPVRGPIWSAVTWLMPMIFFSDDNPEEWKSGLSYLPRLAVHVLPKAAVFEKWLQFCVERLALLYPAPKDDPFEDLFKENEEERRGPLVAREALDPSFDYKPEMARELLTGFLRGVDYTKNPYLRSPKDMLENGLERTPYTL